LKKKFFPSVNSRLERWLAVTAILGFLVAVIAVDYLTEEQPLHSIVLPLFYTLPLLLALLISRLMAIVVAGVGALSAALIPVLKGRFLPYAAADNAMLLISLVSVLALYLIVGAFVRTAALRKEAEERALRLQQIFFGTVSALSNLLDARDPHTARHSHNVAGYALAIAREMDLPRAQREAIYIAGLLHDIGKIGVAEALLKKPGRLLPGEWEEVKRHPVLSYRILRDIPELQEVAIITLYHHEWWDGRGYPYGLKGEQIPLGARILCVADSFDAMISERVYKPALAPEAAIAELKRCAGSQFDPAVVEAFLRCLEKGAPMQRPEAFRFEMAFGLS